jgi:hypothetical protein
MNVWLKSSLAIGLGLFLAGPANAACQPPVGDCCDNGDATWTCWVECETEDGITICEEITIDFGRDQEKSKEFGLSLPSSPSISRLRQSGGRLTTGGRVQAR